MIQVRPITKQLITEGSGKWSPPWSEICCMFGIMKRKFQSSMWLEIFDEVGSIGFTSWENGKPVGQMIFLPKKYARRIGLSTCRTNEDLGGTMVVGCLYVHNEYRNRGIATAMIRELISFCDDHRYNRIEVSVDLGPPDREFISKISFYPFRKFGFIVDETSSGGEFAPETRMCYCSL